MSYDARLAELGITLPAAPAPAGMYAPVVQSGNLLFLAGHIPTKARGKVGSDFTEQDAAAAAEEVAHLMLATIRNHVGSLDHVERIVKVFGLVNCTPDFTNIPQVVNGFSQVTGRSVKVLDYHEHAVGEGANARAVAYLELRVDDRETLFGVGMDDNIVTASLRAIVSGIERARTPAVGDAAAPARREAA